MATKTPTRTGISRLLEAAGFARSEHRRFDGFHVRVDASTAYVTWLPAVMPYSRPLPEEEERSAAAALEMAGRYADALLAAGWPAEVVDLNGPLVRVLPRKA